MTQISNPYQDLVKAGCEVDNHASDLYVKKTKESIEILKKHNIIGSSLLSSFKCNIDGETWFDLPMMYEPFWNKKAKHKGRKL